MRRANVEYLPYVTSRDRNLDGCVLGLCCLMTEHRKYERAKSDFTEAQDLDPDPVTTFTLAHAEITRTIMPFRSYESYEFSESGIAMYAPGAPGIYGIHNGRRLWIYINEAQNIEAQLFAHLRGESVCSSCIMQNRPAYFTFVKGIHHRALPTRKEELIREYRPLCSVV